MKQIYLLFASLGFVFFLLGFPNFSPNVSDSITYSKKIVAEVKQKPNPPKKYRPLVLKPEKILQSETEKTENLWVDNAFLAPSITATKSVTVNGGGNPVPGSQLNYSIVVANGGPDAATAVTFTDILVNDLTLVGGSLKATPIAGDDAYTSIGNVGITVPAGSGLLVNDNSPTNETITVTAVNTAGTSGTVTFNPNGSFTFTPNTGFSGNTTFSYTATGSTSSLTGTGTVTITVLAPIWFVDIAATTSTNVGTLANPFKDWSDFATSNALSGATNPAANQTIFVYSGTYTGAATLKSGQKVLGRGATTTLADFAGITVPSHSSPALPNTNGTKPNLTSAGTTITLGTNNTLRGFDMGNSVKDIVGSSFTTLTASEMALNGDGQALDLATGSLTCTFTSISSNNSADKGISFSAINGTLTSTGGTTITNPAAQGILVFLSSSVNANYGNTSVTGSGGTGVQLASGAFPTTTFGSLTITPDTGQQALVSNSNGGTITCTSGNINSRINLQGASASVKLTLNIELTSHTSDGNLQLSNTTGSFRINGTGTSGSGGSMSGITTGPSIFLNNVSNVSINYFNITNAGKSCFSATNLSGTCVINNCSFSMGTGSSSAVGNDRRCVSIVNKDVALTLNVDGSTFTGNLTASPDNNHGIAYETTTDAANTTVGTLNIKTSAFNRFNNYAVYTTSTGAAVTDVGIQGSTVNYDGGTSFVGGAFHLWNLRSAKTTFNIINNTSLFTKGGLPIEFYSNNFDAGTDFTPASGRALEGKFNGNILTRFSTDNGAVQTDAGTAVNILVKGKSNGVVQVNSNTIIRGNLSVYAQENTPESTTESARLDATITNNIIEELSFNYGIDMVSGSGSENGYSSMIVCGKVSGNTISPLPVANDGLGLIRFFTNGPVAGGGPNVIHLEGANGTSESSLVNYWNNNSNAPTGVTSSGNTRIRDAGFGGTGNKLFKAAGTCLTPANAAPARIAAPDYVKQETPQSETEEVLAENANKEEVIIEKSDKQVVTKSDNLTLTTFENSIASPNSGETVTVNGAGSGFTLPANKSTTITFSATVSATPSTCAIANQATVTFTGGGSPVSSNNLITNLIVPPPTGVTTATAICNGNSIGLVATCSSGTVQWYNAAATGSLLGTTASLGTFTQSPTSNTTYQAACLVGGCESARTNSGLITVNALPVPAPSSNTPVCVGNTLNLTSTTATTYSWTGSSSFTSSVQNPNITNSTTAAGGTYTLTVTNANGCTASATTAVTINSTPAPTSPTATPSNFSVAGTTTLTASGCNSPSTITWYDTANSTVALPNNTPTISSNKTFFARCTGTNTCISNPSTNVVVTFNPCTPLASSPGNVSITWTGLLSTDWNTACNWNPAWVPDATNSQVDIPITTNQPIVSGTVPAINIMYVNGGATLTIASGGTLTVNQSGATSNITMQGNGNSIINDGTINVGGGTSGFGVFVVNTSTITNRGTINANNSNGIVKATTGDLTFLNESAGIVNSDFRANGTTSFNLTNHGTINYSGSAGAFALSLNSASSVINNGTITVTTGAGISNPNGSIINNNACGKILMSAGTYTNGGTTTNAGLIQLPNTLNFTNTGTFTNNGVLKANTVASITNNKMVITNTCPIFTLGGTNNYTVSGIFTDAGATTSAGTYTSVGNKFTANNTIPTGTQTLYAQVTDGTCTFVIPFDFNNVKPTAVSVNSTTVCAGTSVTLSATCASGTITWYNAASGTGIALGTGTGFTTIPVTNPTTYYASCESATCVSGRVATSAVMINPTPAEPTGVASSNSTICSGTTIMLSATCATGTLNWYTTITGGVSIGTSSPLSVTPLVNTTYFPSCELNGCASPRSGSPVVSGVLNNTKPTFNRPTSSGNLSAAGTAVHYNVHPFNFSSTGSKTISLDASDGAVTTPSTFDSFLFLYGTGGFNPASPLTNLVASGDDIAAATNRKSRIIYNVTTTGAYTIVMTSFYNVPDGTSGDNPLPWTYTLAITGAGGNLPITVNPTPNAPTSVSVNQTEVCDGTQIVLTATCGSVPVAPLFSGLSPQAMAEKQLTSSSQAISAIDVIWYNQATGGVAIGTGSPFNHTQAVGTTTYYAACKEGDCESSRVATSTVTVNAIPATPTVTLTTASVVCEPSTLNLTASGCAGMVTWSQGAATGTSLTISTVGTYSITATCTVNGCISDASAPVAGLEIKAKPNAPTITSPTSLSVCSPSTLTLTASGCAGMVTWSQGAATGTSLTLNAIGTYSISATCTVNGCTSDASAAVSGLEIKAKPNAPNITPPTTLVVCSPSTLTLTASGCAGMVTWSQGAATGTSLTLAMVGTYSISATCTVNGCISDASSAVAGLEIKAKPNAPTITPPTSLSVCSPSTLTLTASGCAGIVTWSQGAATGTSLTLNAIGTYSISATCTTNGCISDASSAVSGLEIKAKPNAPTITPPTTLVVCSPSTLTLTASGCAGMVTWSQGAATGTSLTLATAGTYSITATCTVNGCISNASLAVGGLEIKAMPIITATNTGPYTVGQTINLTGTGGGTYNWTGPNNFSSISSTPTVPNALSVNGGVYTLSVLGINGCNAAATTNVVVSGIDPCDPSRIVDYLYVKAGNPYQALFPLTNGAIINQRTEQVSILVTPSLCPSVTIESFEMNLQGPEMNWNILQNVAPNALFDNSGNDVWGRNLKPGIYTLTVTGYAQDNKGGGITYGPKVITFTIVGDLATINAPTLSKTAICAGSNVDVTFSTTGTFNGINQFQIELSDSSGSFSAPVLIGTTNTTGSLNCTIPQSTFEGSKYLIRVSSTNQVAVSNPAMSLVTVHPLNYNLVSPINNLTGTSTKKAVSTINANNKVTSPANVTYQAGKSILLTPGFETSAVFKAVIGGCEN